MSRGARLLLAVLGSILLLLFLGYRVLDNAITSDHSRWSVSDAAEAASREGTLVRVVPVSQDTVLVGHQQFRLSQAWVEEATQLDFKYVLWGRELRRLGCRRLVFTLLRGNGAAVDEPMLDEGKVFGDVKHWQIQYTGGPSNLYIVDLLGDAPDTLRVPLDSATFGETRSCVP